MKRTFIIYAEANLAFEKGCVRHRDKDLPSELDISLRTYKKNAIFHRLKDIGPAIICEADTIFNGAEYFWEYGKLVEPIDGIR